MRVTLFSIDILYTFFRVLPVQEGLKNQAQKSS